MIEYTQENSCLSGSLKKKNRTRRVSDRTLNPPDPLESRALLTVAPPAIAGPWTSAYVDEFHSLNPNVWTNSLFWGEGNTTYSGVFTPNNANVSGGVLDLTAEHVNTVGWDSKTYPVASGRIQSGGIQGATAPGFAFEYGYVDIRMKGNVGNGLWSAAWMLPVSHQDGYEIDIVENRGIEPTTYWGGFHDWYLGKSDWGGTPLSFDETQAFHDYAVDWEPGVLKFYVDGQVVRTYTGSDVPSQPMYLILNLDVGPSAGDPNQAPPFDTMAVDAVAVWQHSPESFLAGQGTGPLANPAPGTFGNSGFEQEQIQGTTSPPYSKHVSDSYWTFNDQSGIEANGSALGAPRSPQGTQAAFLMKQIGATPGQIYQTVNVPARGAFNLTFRAAEYAASGRVLIAVSVDASLVDVVVPSSTTFAAISTKTFILDAGRHTFAFTATSDNVNGTAFVDTVGLSLVASQAPGTPVNLLARAVSATALNLSWSPGTGVATAYPIEIASMSGSVFVAATAPAGATSYLLSGLSESTTYTIRILAINPLGTSPFSNVVRLTTPKFRIRAAMLAFNHRGLMLSSRATLFPDRHRRSD